MTPTNDRQEVLDFTQPYYYTPAVVVVHGRRRLGDRPDHRPRRQEDRRLQRLHLRAVPQQGRSPSRASTFDFVIDDAEVSGYDTDTTALQDLRSNGRARRGDHRRSTTAQGYIDAGNPVKIVGDPIFYEPLSVGFDKSSDPSSESLYEAVDAIVGGDARRRHADRDVGEVVRPGHSPPSSDGHVTP